MKELHEAKETAASPLTGAYRPKTLSLDTALFQHHLDRSGMSEAEMTEYLQMLWSFIVQFVDLGYGIHPVQQSCGKLPQGTAPSAFASGDMVQLEDHQVTETFNASADECKDQREREES